MKHIIVTINISLLLLANFSSSAQVIPKDTIYLEFKINDGTLPHYKGKKFKNKHGINFNLYKGEGLIYPKNGIVNTLEISKLKNYHITKIEDVDSLVRKWQKKTKPLLIKKYGIPYPNTTNKNNMFVTYVIEKFTDHFIKYRVYWRNQRP